MGNTTAFPDAASIRALINENGFLPVHVTPNARRSELRLPEEGGLHALHVRTTATPEDGEANKEVLKLVAKALGIAKSKVTLARGATSRTKMLKVNHAQDCRGRVSIIHAG